MTRVIASSFAIGAFLFAGVVAPAVGQAPPKPTTRSSGTPKGFYHFAFTSVMTPMPKSQAPQQGGSQPGGGAASPDKLTGGANKPVPKTIPMKDVLIGPVMPGADTSRGRQIKPRTNTSGDKAGFGGMSGPMDNWVYSESSAAAKGGGAKGLTATPGKQGIWLTPGFFEVQDDSTKGSGRKPRRSKGDCMSCD